MVVQGVVKSTVVRGEDEFPSGLLRVSDCHDSVLYALAPLQFASIYCCSDCTVVRHASLFRSLGATYSNSETLKSSGLKVLRSEMVSVVLSGNWAPAHSVQMHANTMQGSIVIPQ